MAHPNEQNWSKEEQLAYWINAYNAFTIKLILDHYPVKSIKEIGGIIPFVNSSWDIRFIHIENQTYDLNNLEHGILREHFEEPRIHFAINCASISCPSLRNEAYTAQNLEDQLNEQAIAFLNNPAKNKLEGDPIRVSRIFQWFRGDFVKNGNLVEFLNRYAPTQIEAQVDVKYLKYDWRLNEMGAVQVAK